MEKAGLAVAWAKLETATWNETPATFVRWIKLLLADKDSNLADSTALAIKLKGVSGQPDLIQACRIAKQDDRKRLTRFLNVVERVRGVNHTISHEAELLKASLNMDDQLISLAREGSSALLPRLVQLAYGVADLSQVVNVWASAARDVAFDLAIVLEDLQDFPEWGASQLLEAEKRVATIRRQRLHPDLTQADREKIVDLLAPFFSRLAKATPEEKQYVFLAMCQLAVHTEKTGTATALELGDALHQAVDYPLLIADEELHPLLLSIIDLERPGELIRGDATKRWNLFAEAVLHYLDLDYSSPD
jgi:hypothetical protein